MKLLIDMNLSPLLTDILSKEGYESVHWFSVGDPRAADSEIMDYARANSYIVLTHDLDFGDILAATQARFPSVIQIRTQNVSPDYISNILINALQRFNTQLEKGALISIDEASSRVRILPIM